MVEGGDAAKGLALRGLFREEADAPAGPLWHPGQDPGHHGADEDQVELSELGRILPKDGEDCVGGTAQALRVSGGWARGACQRPAERRGGRAAERRGGRGGAAGGVRALPTTVQLNRNRPSVM